MKSHTPKKRGYSTSSYKARKEGEVAKSIIRWCVRTKRMAHDWEGLRTTLYFFVFLYFVFINFVASILLFIQILMGKFYAWSACSMQKQIDLLLNLTLPYFNWTSLAFIVISKNFSRKILYFGFAIA